MMEWIKIGDAVVRLENIFLFRRQDNNGEYNIVVSIKGEQEHRFHFDTAEERNSEYEKVKKLLEVN